MPLRLHFLRHGQTPASRENRFCGRGLDLPLTADGAAMAEAFAAHHAAPSRATRWRAVFASPLARTMATAAPAAAAAGLAVQPLDGLAELDYGRWDGCTPEAVDRDFHDDHVRWTADPAWNAPTGGETAAALSRRVLEAIETITRSADPTADPTGDATGDATGAAVGPAIGPAGADARRPDDGDVLVVSHKASIRVALCGLLGVDVGRFRFRFACPTGSVTVVEFGPHGPMALAVADRSHLDERLRRLPGT
jgi:probable phosphoglycerate mutase